MKLDGKEKNPIIFSLFEDKISQNGKKMYFCNLITEAIDEMNNMTGFLKTG